MPSATAQKPLPSREQYEFLVALAHLAFMGPGVALHPERVVAHQNSPSQESASRVAIASAARIA